MATITVILEVVGGLVLFLYGVDRLADGLKALSGERMKGWIARFTNNRFAGLLSGTAATTALDSSSVTIIMVIALVNAGLMGFAQSLAVVLGSNIGTTISSQLIAFEVGAFAPLALAIGAGLALLGRSDRQKQIGEIILGFGLIFFGLDYMGSAVEPLKEYQPFLDLMARLENPLLGALVGAAFTVVIQSSSATLGIAITLASQGLITLPAGIALMLGAEVGTCSDTLIATIGRSRAAVRTGIFHLGFNLITAGIGIVLAGPFARLVEAISGGAGVSRQIANAHVLFNVLGALAFIGLLPAIARLLERLLPDRRAAEETGEVGVQVATR